MCIAQALSRGGVDGMQNPERQAGALMAENCRQVKWAVRHSAHTDLDAARSGALREFPLTVWYSLSNALLDINRQAVGVIAAKTAGSELQDQTYREDLSGHLPAPGRTDSRDAMTAVQVLFCQPYAQRLLLAEIKALAATLDP
jgi:hypothetical protein